MNLFRASQIGHIMASPDKDSLPVSAMTYLSKMASQIILDWKEPEMSFYQLEKGKIVEDDSIALFNSVTGNFFIKNTERKENGLFTGECDLHDDEIVIDIKSSYSKKTHELFLNIKSNKMYFWQLVSYAELWDLSKAGLAKVLVDTPMGLYDTRKDEEDWHIVSHIEPHKRVSYAQMSVTSEMKEQLMNRAKLAHLKLNEMLAEYN
jgi:hypothetical protein